MPSVLFTNRVYPPAPGATGAVLAEMAVALVDRGWDVTVVTGPADGAPESEVTEAGVRVERVGALRFTRASTWKRALAYLSHYPAMLTRVLRLPRPDVLVTKTDPPLQLVLGALVHKITGVPAVHWAQDLYPEIAEALGVIPENGSLARLLRRVSTSSLETHDHVVAVGRCMKERIVARGLAANDISIVPNWPPSSVHPVPHEDNPFRGQHDLQGKFVVMYSGNMGLAHPFDAVLDAADELLATHDDIQFVFVGEGPRKSDLQQQTERRGLGNVTFLPFQPYEELDQSLSAADLHLVTMEEEAEGLVVPSKMYGALSAGRPALFLGPTGSEAARLVEEHDCGTALAHPTGTRLANAIRSWYGRPDIESAGRRARSAVEDGFDRAVDAFDRILRSVASRERVPSIRALPASIEP
ncbi:glycosyltransferase WbuB [Longibacter salinarum]|uniref:Glycosyltransferase WbuB n=1 Tax=Longibacter salinarum TaxID=1850348 RepID=A0A2A8CV17_9BACT|nr:glycosyltransferase family 4 protein [Longibacter salinarum]PEN12609.1 glycosyltransferase WbuB [Longibacter salinarum]